MRTFHHQIILCIRLDRFISSVEEALHPELRQRSFVVVGSNQQPVAIGANLKARESGIMPFSQLVDFPAREGALSVVTGRIGRIEEFSKEFFRILHRFSVSVEPVALDEAFVDLTGYEHLWISPEYAAIHIKRELERELNISVTVGVAANKFCAQIAARVRKPDAITVVSAGHEASFLYPLPVELLPGIGKRTSAVLRATGIDTIGSFARLPREACRENLGRAGEVLWRLSNGIDTRNIKRMQRYSVSRSTVIHEGSSYDDRVDTTRKLAENLSSYLNKMNIQARTIAVRLTTSDRTHQHQQTYAHHISASEKLSEAVGYLSDHLYEITNVTRITVIASRLNHLYPDAHRVNDEAFERQTSLRNSLRKLSNLFGSAVSALPA